MIFVRVNNAFILPALVDCFISVVASLVQRWLVGILPAELENRAIRFEQI